MSESENAGHADWNQVGAAFTALGDRIQAHFTHLTGATTPSEEAADTKPLEDLGKSLDAALESFRNAVNDPSIGEAARSAADRLLDAIKTEVGSVAGGSDEAGEVPPQALPPASEDPPTG
jgi:hypothetical protein